MLDQVLPRSNMFFLFCMLDQVNNVTCFFARCMPLPLLFLSLHSEKFKPHEFRKRRTLPTRSRIRSFSAAAQRAFRACM
jgi:hypothetical protein